MRTMLALVVCALLAGVADGGRWPVIDGDGKVWPVVKHDAKWPVLHATKEATKKVLKVPATAIIEVAKPDLVKICGPDGCRYVPAPVATLPKGAVKAGDAPPIVVESGQTVERRQVFRRFRVRR